MRLWEKIQAVPRSLTLLLAIGILLSAQLTAQDWPLAGKNIEPQWTISVPAGPVTAGQSFEVTVEVLLPSGYYQDVESPFLLFEPAAPIQVLERSSSQPQLRSGKPSFTDRFVLRRLVELPIGTPSGLFPLTWQAGWQICQVDGICLLPAQRVIETEIRVVSMTR